MSPVRYWITVLLCVLFLNTCIPSSGAIFKMLKKKKFMEGFLVGFMVGNEYANHKSNKPGPAPQPLYSVPPPSAAQLPPQSYAGEEYSGDDSSSVDPSSYYSSYMRKKSDRIYKYRPSSRSRHKKRKAPNLKKSLMKFPVFIKKSIPRFSQNLE